MAGQILEVKKETNNSFDRYAVATLLNNEFVGHVPQEHSRIFWHFISHDGYITFEFLGEEDTPPDKGLEVPCIYTFSAKPAMIKKLVKLF